ncbi:hypothetical protein [Modestobacter muralis]|uniref:hypothetical protein n=1 Tax=Modestobacter muralis TaxID=1608614 RepID=UPI001FE902A8|nr:hypothetical protein [Modestobacter muralis]
MPPRSAWYLLPLGTALLTWALLGGSWRQRAVQGVVTGAAFFSLTLSWLTGFHPAGFAGVLVIEVVLFAAAMVLVDPCPGRWWTVPAPLVVLEALRARFPFGGFPIPGMALGQLDGPFSPAAPLGGALLVLGLGAAAGAAVTGVAAGGRRPRALVIVGALAAGATAGLVIARPEEAPVGRLQVALVQGGGPRGIPAVASDPDTVTE